MNCDNSRLSPIRLEWDTGPTLYPQKVNFSYSASHFDFLECQFGSEVSSKIRQTFLNPITTEDRDSSLSPYQQVRVYVDDELLRSMYFEPTGNFLNFGDSKQDATLDFSGKIELHDLHEHLEKGVVNYRPQEEKVSTIYEEIFNQRKNANTGDIANEPIKGIIIDIDEDPTSAIGVNSRLVKGSRATSNTFLPEDGRTTFALEFEEVSPFEAIQETNKKTGNSSIISMGGYLYIGDYPINKQETFTASGSGTNVDFHIKSGSLNKNSTLVNRVVVEGPTPAKETIENFAADKDIYISADNARLDAVSVLQDKEYGTIKTFKRHNINVEDLEKVSQDLLLREMEQSNKSPEITLSSYTSSTSPTVNIGDIVEVQTQPVPCTNDVYPGGEFVVKGVEHRFDSKWETTLSVREISQQLDLATGLRLVDLESGQTYTANDIYGYQKEPEAPSSRPRTL